MSELKEGINALAEKRQQEKRQQEKKRVYIVFKDEYDADRNMNALTINSELQKYLVSKHPIHDGVQYKFKFANNYGASVVRHKYSYGGECGLWELAVLDKEDHLCYDTEIADDVVGFLTEEDVFDTLWRIHNL